MPDNVAPKTAPDAAPVQAVKPASPEKPLSFGDIDDHDTAVEDGTATEEAEGEGDEDSDSEADEGAGDEAGDDDEDSDEESEADDTEEESDEDDAEEELEDDDDDDEEESDLDEEAQVHRIKVNGKLKEYTLKQMKQLVSSGAHLVEKRSEFQNEVQAKTTELSRVESELKGRAEKINPAWELLNKGDIEASFLELAKIKGVSKLEARRSLRKQMLPVVARMLGLTETEVTQRLTQNAERIRVWDTQEENEFLKSEQSAPQKSRTEESPESSATKAVQDFQVEYGVSKGEMGKAVDWLLQHKLGGDQSKLTLDEVKKTVLQGRTVDKALEAIQATRPRLIKDQTFVNRVVKKLAHNPEWSTARTARWIKKVVKQQAVEQKDSEAQKLAKDVGRKVLQGKPKSALTKPGTQQKKPMSFRDYDDDNRLI